MKRGSKIGEGTKRWDIFVKLQNKIYVLHIDSPIFYVYDRSLMPIGREYGERKSESLDSGVCARVFQN